MRILLTNDDGIYAPGIQRLCKELEKEHEVFMIAPDRERSATGHAITVHHPLRAKEVSFVGIKSKCIAIDGTPADSVKIGVESLMDIQPEVVVSGINAGPNLGYDVLYSGTVSAAIEGILLGIPAIALSLVSDDRFDYSHAAKFTSRLLKTYEEKKIKNNLLLNINIPIGKSDEYKITKLGNRGYSNLFEQRLDPRGNSYYWMAGEVVEEDNDEDSDVTVVNNGFISITPIKLSLTAFKEMEKLKSWDF